MNGVIKVAVLMGGVGSERAVSLISGQAVATALAEGPFEVVTHDIHPDDLSLLDDASIEVFFPALHGSFGEDGQLQKILEDRKLRFVGSRATACGLMFDKLRTKETLAHVGIRAPQSVSFVDQDRAGLMSEIQAWDKWVVKPVCQGSSVGVSILECLEDVWSVAQETRTAYGPCMIEQFVGGHEVTVGVLLGEALPVIEIRPCHAFYDYQAKYEDDQTQYLFDTLTPTVEKTLQENALIGAQALAVRHFGRLDFLVDDSETAWFLEANAIPGLTDHSLLPKAAQKTGQSMARMCQRLVEAARNEKA